MKLCLFAVAAMLTLGLSVAQADFVAYNDTVWDANFAPAINPNATRINIGSGSPGPSSGLLKDFATGTLTSVTASFTQSGGVIYQPDNTGGGTECNVGTDARNVFDPATTVGLQGVVYYGSTGWYVDLALSGLDPTKTYEFVTSANRNGGSGYDPRLTKYTLSGADAFVNQSTAGVTVGDAGASTTFSTGNNTALGYVARWTGIQPGADGSISFRAQAGSATNQAYTFSAFKLAEVPEPATFALLAIVAVVLRRR